MAKPGEALTEENYDEHVAQVPGIFGDVPTDGTSSHDSVVTKNEAEADTAIAEKDAAVEEGDAEEEDVVSDAEAARQTDAASTTGFAEEVDEAAAEDEDDSDDSDDSADDSDDSDDSEDAASE